MRQGINFIELESNIPLYECTSTGARQAICVRVSVNVNVYVSVSVCVCVCVWLCVCVRPNVRLCACDSYRICMIQSV